MTVISPVWWLIEVFTGVIAMNSISDALCRCSLDVGRCIYSTKPFSKIIVLISIPELLPVLPSLFCRRSLNLENIAQGQWCMVMYVSSLQKSHLEREIYVWKNMRCIYHTMQARGGSVFVEWNVPSGILWDLIINPPFDSSSCSFVNSL